MTYKNEDKVQFIKNLYCPARQVADETGCSWELILAQAAQETGWGEKILPGSNNIFNIKADPSWHGESNIYNVWEMGTAGKIWVNDAFRVYPTLLDSLRDRQKFLAENARYRKAGLFDDDVKGDLGKEAKALRKGGYATDPDYAQALEKVYAGKTMQKAVAAAKLDGCKGCLPTINIRLLDAARTPIADAQIKASQGSRTLALVTDADGRTQVQAALSGGPVAIQVWSDHERKWNVVEHDIEAAFPPGAITLIAPTIRIKTSTEQHRLPETRAIAPSDVAAERASGAENERMGCYTVKRGDSLSRIAKEHSTSYARLAHLNGISSPFHIFPGQTLKIVEPNGKAEHVPPHRAVHTTRYRNRSDHPQTEVLTSCRAPWMAVAEQEFHAGVRRRGGAHPDQHIQEYFSATSLHRQRSDTLPYCAAFVNWCLKQAGFAGNNNARAESLAAWGRSTRGNQPAYGAVAVVSFPGGGHHVTFVNGVTPGAGPRIATLGGNQGHAHEVSKSALPRSWVTHYRLPGDYVEHDEDYELAVVSVDSAQMTHSSTH